MASDPASTASLGLFAIPTNSCTLPWTAVGGVCSGHGQCVFNPQYNRETCVCDEGWSGAADFGITSSLTACSINLAVVRGLWGAILVIFVILYVTSAGPVLELYQRHLTVVRNHRAQGKVYRLYHNSSLFGVVVMMSLGLPSAIALCILKLVNPEMLVGLDVAPTIFWWITRSCVYMVTFLVQPSLLGALLRSTPGLERVILLNRVLSAFFGSGAILSGILAIWPMSAKANYDFFNPVPGIAAFIFLGSSLVVVLFASALQAIYIERTINHMLTQSHRVAKDERTLRIKQKLTAVQHQLFFAMMLQVVLYGILTCFPFLWMNHQYVLPISWLVLVSVQRQVMRSLKSEESKKSTDTSTTPGKVENRKQAPPPIKAPDSEATSFEYAQKQPHVYGIEESKAALTELNTPRQVGDRERLTEPPISVNFSSGVPASDFASEALVESNTETENPAFAAKRRTLAEADAAAQAAVAVRVSPAMRLISMMTPKSKAASGGGRFFGGPESPAKGE